MTVIGPDAKSGVSERPSAHGDKTGPRPRGPRQPVLTQVRHRPWSPVVLSTSIAWLRAVGRRGRKTLEVQVRTIIRQRIARANILAQHPVSAAENRVVANPS